MMIRLVFWVMVLLSVHTSVGQSLAIGQWRDHLPYQTGRLVTQSDRTVFFATQWSLVAIDKEEGAVNFLSKVEGLSNVGIRLIRYNREAEVLLVVYDNSVVDLVRPDGRVITLNQIRNFANFVGEKVVYDIFNESDSTVLLAANYGISRLNVRSVEFAFTTFTGVDVQAVEVYEGFIYAATPEGIYRIQVADQNPENFGNWELLGPQQGFPEFYAAAVLEHYQGSLYFDIDGVLYRYAGGTPERFFDDPGRSLAYLSGEGPHLLVGYRCLQNCSGLGMTYYFSGAGAEAGALPENCFGVPNYAIEDEKGRIWLGDDWRGFRMVPGVDAASCEFLSFNSPYSHNSREITIANNQVWVASGGVNQTFSYVFRDDGFFSFLDGQWATYNRFTWDALKGADPFDGDDDLFDFLTIAIHPDNGKVYAGSFFEGLIEFDGEKMVLYNETNSSLTNSVGDTKRTRVSGLAFDADGNLWVANHTAEQPVSVLWNDGEWQSFRPACGVSEIHQVAVDAAGYKWFVSNSSSVGVIVFDEGDPENPNDDRCRTFTEVNSNLPTNNTNCLAVDLEGDVWVGTTEGVVIFECGASAFEPPCQGSRRIVDQDGFLAYLLETEEVQTIAVDGANRKWVGTKNGVFVLSPSGEEEILRFTADNSPLPDNNVIDIAVNDLTGEVFIGTDKGIVSYQADAVAGGRVHRQEVEVYPNPVSPDYNGPIVIRGLSRDANVKITDSAGRLVFETTALGGQAVWYGKDYQGRAAHSGVYLVFSSTNPRNAGFSNPTSAVARIVLINGRGKQ